MKQRLNNIHRYNDYSTWIRKQFNERVQKISVDAGFTCPNRDGTKGVGGCIYCDNKTFSPAYCSSRKSITQQLNEGIDFFSKKYPTQKYIAYFQAYTNTYANLNILEKYYNEALSYPKVIGIAISTRPDCVNDETLNLIAQLSKQHFVTLEFGVESTSNETLKSINRCHSFEDSKNAILKASGLDINIGAHLILGLPGESKEQIVKHAEIISDLPILILKLHQLQIIKDTKLAQMFEQNPAFIKLYTATEYIDLAIDFIENLSPDIIIERFTSESPREKIIAPNWGGLKNFEIVAQIKKRLVERETWQGRLYKTNPLRHCD